MIDTALQQSLRERFNPDGSLLRTHQMRLLEMLIFIDKVCRENAIPYWLSSGTLIGAVRHGGFIPWDDDVDIEMLSPDVKRFVEVMETLNHPDYVVQTSDSDPAYIYPFAKLRDLHTVIDEADGLDRQWKYRGRFIDIFSMEPSSSLAVFRLGSKLVGTEAKLLVKHPDSKFVKIIHHGLQKCVYPLLRSLNSVGECDRLRHTIPNYFPKPRRASDIFPLGEIEFEGHKFMAPGDSDAYLRAIYGDYMRIPPLDRIQVHATSIRDI